VLGFTVIFVLFLPKGNSVSILVSKIWREPLKKLAGAPFLKKGGLRPPFVHFPLLLKRKKGFPAVFSKKEFPRNIQKVFPPELTVQKYRPKMPIPAVSDTG